MGSISTTWRSGCTLSPCLPAICRLTGGKGIDLVRQTHGAFVLPGRGVIWKMKEDLSAPYPGYGLGALDAFDGYISYRCLGEEPLRHEIAEMKALIDLSAPELFITQDLGLGMMLWMTHFFPDEEWAVSQRGRCLRQLDAMWQRDSYFCREPELPERKNCFYQLWRLGRTSGGARNAPTRAAAE